MQGPRWKAWVRKWQIRMRGDEGNVAILVALAMVALCGFAALVIDAGVLYVQKQQAQAGADAGALAGADDLVQGASQAAQTAYNLAAQNTSMVHINATASTDTNTVTVTGQKDMGLWFARVLGIQTAGIRVSSTAKIGTLKSMIGVVPIGVPNQTFTYGQEYTLSEGPGDGYSGNYGYLDLSGNGAQGVSDNIKYGYPYQLTVGQQVLTKPGVNWGPVSSAIDYRLEEAANDPNSQSWQTVKSDSPRVMYLPVIDTLDVNGKKPVTILGFAAFYLEGIDDDTKQISGRYLRMIRPGELGGGTDYGTYGVKLTN